MTLRLLPSTMKWLNRPGREAGSTGRCGHRPLGEDSFTPTSGAVFASRSGYCSAHRSEKVGNSTCTMSKFNYPQIRSGVLLLREEKDAEVVSAVSVPAVLGWVVFCFDICMC